VGVGHASLGGDGQVLNVGHLGGWRVDPHGCWQRGWLGSRE
jgi:hypothetical protein